MGNRTLYLVCGIVLLLVLLGCCTATNRGCSSDEKRPTVPNPTSTYPPTTSSVPSVEATAPGQPQEQGNTVPGSELQENEQEEEGECFFEVDLANANTTCQDGVVSYDFNLESSQGEIVFYGLAAEDDDRLALLLQGIPRVSRIELSNGETTQTFLPASIPEDLEMKIEGAPGDQVAFDLPLNGAVNNRFLVFYEN